MKYSTQFVLLLAIATFLPVFTITPIVAKSSCDDTTQQIPPSSKLREIKLNNYGVVFKIPANYRTTINRQKKGDYIDIFSPAEYQYVECLTRNSIGGDVDSTAGITIIPTDGKYQNVSEFVNSGLTDNFNFYRLLKKTKIAGQPALIYEFTHRKGLITAIFLSPDKQLGIAIDTLNDDNNPVISRIFDGILTSFKFGNKTAESQTRQTTASIAQVTPKLAISTTKPKGCVDDRELKKGPLEFYIIHDPENSANNSPAAIRIREQPSTKSAILHVASSGNPVIIYQQVVIDNYCWLKVDVTSVSKNDPTSYITVRGWVRGDFVIPSQNI
ncbi:hypothetical protein NIES22_14560 [Calothrix brevissima NIES-22]|nr:hypothetical protein NIES22_14560 [Calothrix brevissima NIES-22]